MNIPLAELIVKFFYFICRVEVEHFRRRGLYSSTCGWRTNMSTGLSVSTLPSPMFLNHGQLPFTILPNLY